MDYTSEKLKHIAIGTVITVAVLAVIGTGLMSGAVSEGFEIADSNIVKGTATQSVFSISVKNIGNSPISNIQGNIPDLPDGTFQFVVLVGTLDVGASASFAGILPNSDTLAVGTSYPVIVNATSAQGNVIVETSVLYVSRI